MPFARENMATGWQGMSGVPLEPKTKTRVTPRAAWLTTVDFPTPAQATIVTTFTSWLANRIRARALSPVEVIDSIIERIQERNSSLNAFVYIGFADAQRNAQEAERAVIAGDPLGPLHGVPVALKDNFDFKPG
jgi:hypothetical protein